MSTPQMAQFHHDPSIYDTGVNFRTEVRVSSRAASIQQEAPPKLAQPAADGTTETVGNLIAVRENYRLQDVRKCFSVIVGTINFRVKPAGSEYPVGTPFSAKGFSGR